MELFVAVLANCLLAHSHQVLVEVHVVDRAENRGEDLVGGEEVMEVGATEAPSTGVTLA